MSASVLASVQVGFVLAGFVLVDFGSVDFVSLASVVRLVLTGLTG